MKIGVTIHDNDFYLTIMSFMSCVPKINETYLGYKGKQITKEHFIRFWNEVIFGFYITCQNCEQNKTSQELEYTRKHLQIKEENVFFNEEVDQYIASYEHHNLEFFTIDIDDNTDNIKLKCY